MSYTKGKWEVTKHRPLDNWCIDVNPEDMIHRFSVAQCYGNKADALLIAATVNACASVNPDNPLAVAESIKDMYEALKELVEYQQKYGGVTPCLHNALAALAKTKGKD